MASPFTQVETDEFRLFFDFVDKDRKGYVSRKEFGSVLRTLDQTLTDSELDDMTKDIKSNGTDTMNFEEFLSLLHRKMSEVSREEGDFHDVCESHATDDGGRPKTSCNSSLHPERNVTVKQSESGNITTGCSRNG